MAKRIITKIGDVFCTEFDNGTKVFFQYIANDLEQLNSSVIRAFKTHYPIYKEIGIENIVKDDVDFYAHTVLRPGIEKNVWYRIGKSSNLETDKLKKIIFGQAQEIKTISPTEPIIVDPVKNWFIWHINQESVNIGILPENLYDKIEPGSVMPYNQIITRMYRGYYTYTLPVYRILKRHPRPNVNSYLKFLENENQIFQCFKGDYFDKAVIVKTDKILRITRDDAIINHMDIAHKKFSDTNWEHDNFITEEEFNQVWNRD